ncbi:MAG: response regulator [Reinekea sp.]|jgi:signal transduction histidine kinase/CheY-like chemotaxis protein
MNSLEGAEVSCKVLRVLLVELQRRREDPEQYLYQIPHDLDYLLNQSNRISWDDLRQIMDNVSTRLGYSNEDFVRVGHCFEKIPFFAMLGVISRALFSLPEFYRWLDGKSSDSPAYQTVSCVTVTATYDKDLNYIISMQVDEGYSEIPQFYSTSKGILEVMPRLYGLPKTNVSMERIDGGCIYSFHVKDVGGWLASIRRFVSRHLFGHRTAEHLRSAQAELHQKNMQLVRENKRLKESRSQLKTALKGVEEASHAKSEFLHRMSHEIRTPMNGIVGASSLLMNIVEDDEQLELATVIKESSDSLMNMLSDVLDLSKIESGETTVTLEAGQPIEVLRSVYNLFKTKAEKKSINLYLIPGQGVEQWVEMDVARLKQLLMNLTSNAIKFTESGGVTLYGIVEEEFLHFAVSDTGVGIKKEDQQMIFESFNQARSKESKTVKLESVELDFNNMQGLGLGLSISQKLVHLLGGDLTLRSSPGQGTVVDLKFPVRVMPAPDKLEAIVSEDEINEQVKLNVLLVEDNPVNRLVINKQLRRLGHSVEFAENGQEGVDKALSHSFDVILMDIMMPVMNGIEATECIREHLSSTALPIIGVSANIAAEDIRTYFQAGMNEYIAKPLQLAQLNQLLLKYQYEKQDEQENMAAH